MTERLHPILLTVVTFLGICFCLIGLMPTWMMVKSEYKQFEIPDEVSAIEYLFLNFSKVTFINVTQEEDMEWEGQIGGHDILIIWRQTYGGWISIYHLEIWRFGPFSIYTGEHRMEWYQETLIGNYLNISRTNYSFEETGGARFKIKCDHFYFFFLLYYNPENYTNFQEAFNQNDFWMVLGITFDQVASTLSSWDIISSILFFQAPQIHPLLNFIIALPIWVSIGFLIYEFIRRLIPFLP